MQHTGTQASRCANRFNHDRRKLEFVRDEDWKTEVMLSWRPADIEQVLDRAQVSLEDAAANLRLKYQVPSRFGARPCAPASL